jgi:hypothetical protein
MTAPTEDDDWSDSEKLEFMLSGVFNYLENVLLDPQNTGIGFMTHLCEDIYHFLLKCLLDGLMADMERLALPDPDNVGKVLSAQQFERMQCVKELVTEYFTQKYCIRPTAFNRCKPLTRLTVILDTCRLNTQDVIREIEQLPQDESQSVACSEAQRLTRPPYLCKARLFALLRSRVTDDSDADRFVSGNQSFWGKASDFWNRR